MEESGIIELKSKLFDLECDLFDGKRKNREIELLRLKYILYSIITFKKRPELDSLEKVDKKKIKKEISNVKDQIFFLQHPGMYN